jgi:hypothetical protein
MQETAGKSRFGENSVFQSILCLNLGVKNSGNCEKLRHSQRKDTSNASNALNVNCP